MYYSELLICLKRFLENSGAWWLRPKGVFSYIYKVGSDHFIVDSVFFISFRFTHKDTETINYQLWVKGQKCPFQDLPGVLIFITEKFGHIFSPCVSCALQFHLLLQRGNCCCTSQLLFKVTPMVYFEIQLCQHSVSKLSGEFSVHAVQPLPLTWALSLLLSTLV